MLFERPQLSDDTKPKDKETLQTGFPAFSWICQLRQVFGVPGAGSWLAVTLTEAAFSIAR